MTDIKLIPFQMNHSKYKLYETENDLMSESTITMKIVDAANGLDKQSLYLNGIWVTYVISDRVLREVSHEDTMKLVKTIRRFNDRIHD